MKVIIAILVFFFILLFFPMVVYLGGLFVALDPAWLFHAGEKGRMFFLFLTFVPMLFCLPIAIEAAVEVADS